MILSVVYDDEVLDIKFQNQYRYAAGVELIGTSALRFQCKAFAKVRFFRGSVSNTFNSQF